MASFTAGTTFVDGVSNDVTAAKLGALVTNATPTSGFIQDRTAETVVGTNDTILIGDASDSNNLKRMTVANILKAPLVSTSGTIDNLTTGTTTSTAQIVTSGTTATFNSTTGTIATLNSTTGTIANLVATTSTFLGAITGSTNVVNIGSGQIYKDASGNVGIKNSTPSSYNAAATDLVIGSGSSNSGITITASTNGLGSIHFSDGTSGDTAYRGIIKYEHTTDNLQLFTAATERLRIDSSGNVGIGTGGTAAASKLDVYGVGNFQSIELGKSGQTGNRDCLIDLTGDDTYTDYGFRIIRQNTGANADAYLTNRGTGNVIVESAEAGQVLFNTNSTTRLIVNSSGNVGIGTTSPATKLDVYGDGHFQSIEVGKAGQTGNRNALIDFVGDDTYSDYGLRIIRADTGANANSVFVHRGTGGLFFQTTEAGAINFQTTGTQRLSIDAANGTLTSQPTYDNTAAGSAVVVTSAGLIRRTSSSIKYKKDIENLYGSIVDNAISNLRPVWYRTKNPEGDDKSTWSHVGLIAEEVNSVEPRLVKYKTVEVSIGENGERIETQLENPIPEDVDYAKLSVILLSEVKAQKAKIASLEARIEALEAA